MKAYACIDIGGTAVKYGVLDQKLNIIGKWETPSRAAEGKEALVKQIREIAAFLSNKDKRSAVSRSRAPAW